MAILKQRERTGGRGKRQVTCKDLNPPCSRNNTPTVSRGTTHRDGEDNGKRKRWKRMKKEKGGERQKVVITG